MAEKIRDNLYRLEIPLVGNPLKTLNSYLITGERNLLIGGGIGYALKTAISQGAKRGLFSNEAGMGSTPHAHAQADVKKPHDQGVVAMIGVFIDTFVVLTITALVVISTLYVGGDLGTKAGLAATLEEGVITTYSPDVLIKSKAKSSIAVGSIAIYQLL